MDATAAACGQKAVATGGDAPSSPRAAPPEAVPGQQLAPLPGDATAAVDSASATETGTAESGGGGEDEQVEKFYALLANMRAMRDMYRAGAGASTDSASGPRKRLRGAEPPWRPAFRMEDFEEPGGTCSPNKERRDDVDGARRPGKQTAGEDGYDVERKGS